jgi:hypothetical protein
MSRRQFWFSTYVNAVVWLVSVKHLTDQLKDTGCELKAAAQSMDTVCKLSECKTVGLVEGHSA